MARDVSTAGAMNDLPTPGQPDFDLNTMRLQQMHGPYPLVHKPSFVPPVPASTSDVSGTVPPQAPIDVEPLLAKVMASTPQQAAAPPAPPIPQLKPGSAKQQTVSADFVPTPGRGGTMMGRSVDTLMENNKRAAAEGEPAPHVPSGGANVSGGELAAGGGTAALVATLLYRLLRGGGGAGAANEVGKVLSLGGKEVAPALEDYRVPAYHDDTIPNVSDEQRMAVNDASGGQPVNQATQDKVQRQIDIDAGTIAPQDYLAGEKPKPGTPGYKIWFKSRQDAAKKPK